MEVSGQFHAPAALPGRKIEINILLVYTCTSLIQNFIEIRQKIKEVLKRRHTFPHGQLAHTIIEVGKPVTVTLSLPDQ
jgi:hypothetical protein